MTRSGATVRIQRFYFFWIMIGYACLAYATTFVVCLIDHDTTAIWPACALLIVGEFALAFIGSTCKSRCADVLMDEHGLSLDGRILIPTSTMQLTHVREKDDRTWLVLQGAWDAYLEIEVADQRDAATLLQAMRLDPRGVVVRYPWVDVGRSNEWLSRAMTCSPFVLLVAAIIAFATQAVFSHPFATLLQLALLEFGMCLLFSARIERVELGADGMRMKRWPRRSRFVSFASIAHIRNEKLGFIVTLLDGNEIVWHAGVRLLPITAQKWESFVKRVVDGFEAHRARGDEGTTNDLAQRTRSTLAWLDDLARVADGDHARYRIATLSQDALWRVLEDVHAEPSARVGAAIAMRRQLDVEARTRIVRIAETCAFTAVRDGLYAAITASDADLAASVERSLRSL